MATDKELAQKKERVEKLRGQVLELTDKAATAIREQSNDIEMARLDAEEQRLQLEVETLKAASSARTIKEGAQVVKDQIAGTASGVVVDTTPEGNSDVPDENKDKE